MAETCETCGTSLAIGAWPFCGGKNAHGPAHASIVPDGIPGGLVVENGFPEPIRVFSHSEHRRLLAERGLEIRAKWVPGDQHLSRMDIPCQTTLENARILLSRSSTPRASAPAPERYHITVTDRRQERP